MTISISAAPREEYSGNGSTTVFAYTYEITTASDLNVILVASDDTETTQVLNTDYTVSGAGDAGGGNVTMTTAPASGETLIIERDIPATQPHDLIANDALDAESLEDALDRVTMLVQQTERDIARSMRHAKGTLDSVSVTLPAPTAGALLGWNSTADAIINSGGSTENTIAVSTFMETVLDDATQAAAQTTLGLGTTDSPQFTGVNVGHASDTTITRASAGDISVEGNVVYRAGGTDVPVTDGGTGASSAADARTNLGLVIGTDVQAYDAGLADIAGLAVTDGNIIVGDGANWVAESGATARASLGLSDPILDKANPGAIGGTTPAAGSFTTLTKTSAAQAGFGLSFVAAYRSAGTENVTGNGTVYTVTWNTEIVDRAGDFASNTFTARYTGWHRVNVHLQVYGVSTSCTGITLTLVATGQSYDIGGVTPSSGNAPNQMRIACSKVIYMTAADTFTITLTATGEGADTVDLDGTKKWSGLEIEYLGA